MGWLFNVGWGRKSIIASLTANESREKDGILVSHNCLAHCFRGCAYSGVLWSVWEITYIKDGIDVKPARRLIRCDLCQYRKGDGWGYKDMTEADHPYYLSCPLKYLDMTPEVCKEWRELVRKYHADKKEQRLAKKLALQGT